MTYRTQEHCHISWCDEGKDHKGWHYGENEPVGKLGTIRTRCGPPTITNNAAIDCWETTLSPQERKGLNLGPKGLSIFGEKQTVFHRLFYWMKYLFVRPPHTPT